MRPPSLCVVTPSFNQGRFIGRTVDAVLSQGIEDLDYVVMDGGSTDETVTILDGYGSRLRYVSEPDGGQAQAVNKGVAATSGEIIAWINSDDVYYPGALGAVREFFAARPEVDVVYGLAEHIDVEDRFIEAYPTEPFDIERLREVCFICQPAAFFRRRAVERFGPLDEGRRYCMDYELWLRWAKAGAVFAHLPRRLAGSRFYAQTKTLGATVAVHEEICAMMVDLFGRAPERWIFNLAHARLRDRGRTDGSAGFTPALCLEAARASLAYNRGLSFSLLKTMASWLRG